MPVVGSFGPLFILESWFVPEKHVLTFATSGPGSTTNPVGVREHTNAAYRGMRIIPGRDQRYPLIESYYQRSFGTGVPVAVKAFETASHYVDAIFGCGVGGLIHAAVGSFGGCGGVPNRFGLAA